MAVFQYTGVDAASGKSVKGYRDAENARALRAALRKEGVLLASAQEGSEKKKQVRGEVNLNLLSLLNRVKAADVAVVTRQLATLVRAGIPLVDSISALVEQVEQQEFVRILSDVREKLKEGTSFEKALQAHPRVFPPLYVNMVAAGEASGMLELVLERLADFMEAQSRLKGKLTAALAYPIAMGFFASGLVTFLMIAVVPQLTSIFDNLGQALPWYTQLLIFSSGVLNDFWWLILMLMGGGTWYFLKWKQTEKGHLKWDTFRLSMPIFGRLNLLAALARFTRTLSTLLGSGVQLLPAMEIGRNVLENIKLENVITTAIGSIREGESIAEPLKRSGAFPPMLTHMIAVGEKSGQLEDMLTNVSRAYEAEVETKLAAVTSLLEPVMIVVMGGAVGFIIISIMMPLMQMNNLVQ